jgi:hypothetical protein
VIDAPVVGDAKQPRLERTRIVERVEPSVRVEERFLNDVLSLRDRSGHPRAVAVQTRAQGGDRFEKREVTAVEAADLVQIVGVIHTDLYAAGRVQDTPAPRRLRPRGRVA